MENSQPIDTLRIKSADRVRILEALDERAGFSPISEQNRVQRRFVYRADDVLLKVYGDGMDARRFSVCGRNISSGGMAFLHGGFLHSGTRMQVCLVRLDGKVSKVSGRVVRCRHVAGRIHEVGMIFDSKIEVDAYADPEKAVRRGPVRTEVPAEMPRIHGRVLCIHQEVDECQNMVHRLQVAGARAHGVGYLGKGLDTIRRVRVDVVICGTELEEAPGPSAVMYMRRVGYRGGVVSVRDKASPGRIEALMEAGANRVLMTPVSTRDLVMAVAESVTGRRGTPRAA